MMTKHLEKKISKYYSETMEITLINAILTPGVTVRKTWLYES
jgi:hypothetical protein